MFDKYVQRDRYSTVPNNRLCTFTLLENFFPTCRSYYSGLLFITENLLYVYLFFNFYTLLYACQEQSVIRDTRVYYISLMIKSQKIWLFVKKMVLSKKELNFPFIDFFFFQNTSLYNFLTVFQSNSIALLDYASKKNRAGVKKKIILII